MKRDFINCLEMALAKLTDIWDKLGIVGEACDSRKEVVMLHLTNLLDEMVREEEAMKFRVEENINKFSTELNRLTKELFLPEYKVNTSFRPFEMV